MVVLMELMELLELWEMWRVLKGLVFQMLVRVCRVLLWGSGLQVCQ